MSAIAVAVVGGVALTAASAGLSMANSGSKPSVPNAPSVDLAAEQRKAIAANTANLPAAEVLTGQANLFSQQQITQMMNSVTPGFSGASNLAMGNITSMLKGQLPASVSSSVMRGSAAKGLSLGVGGSGMGRDLVARDLGLTDLQMTQAALTSLESWTSNMAKLYEPGMSNVGSMFITPKDMYQASATNAQNQFSQQWMQNQVDAMPDPTMTALAKGLGGLGSGLTGGLGGIKALNLGSSTTAANNGAGAGFYNLLDKKNSAGSNWTPTWVG